MLMFGATRNLLEYRYLALASLFITALALDLVLGDTTIQQLRESGPRGLTVELDNPSSCFSDEDRLFVCVTSFNNPSRSANLDLILDSLAGLCSAKQGKLSPNYIVAL